MYTTKQMCEKNHMIHETLKWCCNQGLIPNENIREIKVCLSLCLQGKSSIPKRKKILEHK